MNRQLVWATDRFAMGLADLYAGQDEYEPWRGGSSLEWDWDLLSDDSPTVTTGLGLVVGLLGLIYVK